MNVCLTTLRIVGEKVPMRNDVDNRIEDPVAITGPEASHMEHVQQSENGVGRHFSVCCLALLVVETEAFEAVDDLRE